MPRQRCLPVLICLLAASWAAAEVTDVIDSFEAPFVNGPVGTQPPGWAYFGYGPPAWSTVETGFTSDGAQSYAWRLPIDSVKDRCGTPGVCEGFSALMQSGVNLDSLAKRTIDWTQPVTMSIDVYCADVSVNGKWKTGLSISSVPRDETNAFVEWGDNGIPNDQWHTVWILFGPDAQTASGTLHFYVDFQVASTDSGENTALFDNLRITYTPIPEPEDCDNDSDDDLDGLTDCDDIDDCTGDPACPCNLIVVFDSDYDGDVDQADFSLLQSCITGTGDPQGLFGSLPAICQCLDVTGPGDVPDDALDQQDLVAFELCASGPGIPADPACDD